VVVVGATVVVVVLEAGTPPERVIDHVRIMAEIVFMAAPAPAVAFPLFPQHIIGNESPVVP
jgi:hypothetical protein